MSSTTNPPLDLTVLDETKHREVYTVTPSRSTTLETNTMGSITLGGMKRESSSCGVTHTPVWHSGMDDELNCNVCGLYYNLRGEPCPSCTVNTGGEARGNQSALRSESTDTIGDSNNSSLIEPIKLQTTYTPFPKPDRFMRSSMDSADYARTFRLRDALHIGPRAGGRPAANEPYIPLNMGSMRFAKERLQQMALRKVNSAPRSSLSRTAGMANDEDLSTANGIEDRKIAEDIDITRYPNFNPSKDSLREAFTLKPNDSLANEKGGTKGVDSIGDQKEYTKETSTSNGILPILKETKSTRILYYIFVAAVMLGLGVPKITASYQEEIVTSNALDWIIGVPVALVTLWIGVLKERDACARSRRILRDNL